MNDAHVQLIERFYKAFDDGDGNAMAECYAPDVHFSDPVFPDLRGEQAGAMWKMFTEGPGELRVELLEHDADDTSGTAHWKAHYNFSETGRPVVNDIHATFTFKDGLIVDHRDDFSFYAWSKQALGAPGLLLGWTPIVKGAVRKKAAGMLAKYTATSGNDAK
ncbi:MAG: nuclear transport factor 2 family protein [Actinomycetota bacterium]|nr:nuclear transport factor 2 family protein [Actinomycetota bacterium]